MIDTISCIPIDLPALILKENLLSNKDFLRKLKETDATSNQSSVLNVNV